MTFKRTYLSLALLLVAGQVAANDMVPGKQQQKPILLTDATIHTATQGVLEQTDLLMVDGKIAKIGQDLTAPANAEVVDLKGKHKYPG